MFHWSPKEFQKFQETINDSSKKLVDVVENFIGNNINQLKSKDEFMDNNKFVSFMEQYLDVDVLPEFCRYLFSSLIRRQSIPIKITSTESETNPRNSGNKNVLVHSTSETSSSSRSSLIDNCRVLLRRRSTEVRCSQISFKDLICCLTLLEAGTPANKLEFMFRIYDTDANGILDAYEIDCIINQMLNVADYSGWDKGELKPILADLMKDMDYDSDGFVSLEEWTRAGLTSVPLSILLGIDQANINEGSHLFHLKHFKSPTHCNLCGNLLIGFGKQGFCCSLCKYTIHERCTMKVTENCICTYNKTRKTIPMMNHFWVKSDVRSKCDYCKGSIKSFKWPSGQKCRWCKIAIHMRCEKDVAMKCDLGRHKQHILPPVNIYLAVLINDVSKCHSNLNSHSDDIDDNIDHSNVKNSHEETPSLLRIMSIVDETIPLLVFVNPKSGGKQGKILLQKFQYLLNPRQIFDISSTGGFTLGLQFFYNLERQRILCCGGDGTVGWLLDSMDKIGYANYRPPVAVLPIGTGNDMARCLRWGGGYTGEDLEKILDEISQSKEVLMDRWSIQIDPNPSIIPTPNDGVLPYFVNHPPPCLIINNYFSIGVDASIAHRFHVMREKYPQKFNSRMKNKLWYLEFGTFETLRSTCKNLHEDINIICDGVSIDFSNGPSLEGIALLNIPSIYGGSNLWGETRGSNRKKICAKQDHQDRELSSGSMSSDLSNTIQDIGDDLIEVVGLMGSIHVAQVKGGIQSGRRLGQCSSVIIETKRRFPMQIDGEPWIQDPCLITISHKNKVPMLMSNHSSKRSSFFNFLKR